MSPPQIRQLVSRHFGRCGLRLDGLPGDAQFLSPPEVPEAGVHQIEAGPTNDPEFLDKPGSSIVRFGVEPVIVVRLSETDFRAFAGTCTHLDCIVEFQKGDRAAVVQLPQRWLRHVWPQHHRAAAQAAGSVPGRPGSGEHQPTSHR